MSRETRAEWRAAAEALGFRKLDAAAAGYPSAEFFFDGERFLDLWFDEDEIRAVVLNAYLAEGQGPDRVWTAASNPAGRDSALLARALVDFVLRLSPRELKPLPLAGLQSLGTIVATQRERLRAGTAQLRSFGGDLLDERFAYERAHEAEVDRSQRD
jgi:hypothetical protein